MSWNPIARRDFLATGVAAIVGLLPRFALAREPALPPVRVVTRGPKHHWFGYYDKLEFDPTGRYLLGMEVDFEHRAPTPKDEIAVGMIDLADSDRWIELGRTTAWCWQQGCMLQWLPGSADEVIWNERGEHGFTSRILNVKTGTARSVPHAVYALAPDSRTAIATDFRRLNDTRPGYGYAGLPDPFAAELRPAESGIFSIDLSTGQQKLLLSIAEVAAMGPQLPGMEGAKHWFNHLLFNQDGSRFVFLHRWQRGNSRATRMVTANADGSEPRVVDANGLTSHFIWRDPTHLLAFSEQPSHGRGFYLFEDGGDRTVAVVGRDVMTQDGHCTYLPGSEWILNDTYPDAERRQNPFLYHVASGKVVPLGHFPAPREYSGSWRCDTHPRFSPDGTKVVIDSPTPNAGRQLHLIDISRIVAQ
jgi:hypothetical protein